MQIQICSALFCNCSSDNSCILQDNIYRGENHNWHHHLNFNAKAIKETLRLQYKLTKSNNFLNIQTDITICNNQLVLIENKITGRQMLSSEKVTMIWILA